MLAAVERIAASVGDGAHPAADDLAALAAWQAGVAAAADILKADLAGFRLADLTAAADEFDRRAAERGHAELARVLADIAAADVTRCPPLSGVAERARGLEPSNMPEELRAAFRALHRLMTTSAAADAAPADAELVLGEFGMPVLLTAVGALHRAPGAAATDAAAPAEPETPAEPEMPAETQVQTLADEPARLEAADQQDQQDPPGADVPPGAVVPAAAHLPEVIDLPDIPSGPEIDADGPEARIAAALAAGRPGLAYWYTVAYALPAPVQAAFEVLALSEAVTMEGDDASVRIRELLKDFDATAVEAGGPCYLNVLAAGAARALLRMPFSPCAEVLDDALWLLGEDGAHDFLRAVKDARDVGFDLNRLDHALKRSVAEYVQQRDEALANLATVLTAVRGANIRFFRATQVLKKIVGEAGKVGRPVARVLAEPDGVTGAEELLAELRDVRAIDRLIDETDQRMNPVAARRAPIVSHARDLIRSNLGDILDALRGYVEAAGALAARRRTITSDQLPGAVDAMRKTTAEPGGDPPATPAASIGYFALTRVRQWIRDALRDGRGTPAAPDLSIYGDLIRGFELDWRPDGTVELVSVTPQALDALADRLPRDAYLGFVAKDDHLGAARIIEEARAQGQAELAVQLAARQPDDQRSSRERLRQLADKAARELAHALYSALLSDSQSTELQGELERYRNPDVQDFPQARRHLDAIIVEVERARTQRIDEARQQLAELDCSGADRDRIRAQLDVGDLVTALEFVSLLKSGKELPAEVPTDESFTDFWPEFVQGAHEASGRGDGTDPGWLEKRLQHGGEISGVWLLPRESDQVIEAGLKGWVKLARIRRGHGWEVALKDVLTLLGLGVKGRIPDNLYDSVRRIWSGEIRAGINGNALVPAYGSVSDGSYQLLLCWGKRSPETLVELPEELPRKSPAVVLYFNTLSQRERRKLAEYSRSKHRGSAMVVIDNAVIAFLTSRTEPRMQATMALTLPFTAINPYTPFVLGDVPRELFYGRAKELAAVQDANGPLYVYGGRQLGKSALLKTATREFAATDAKRRSVYLDLKGEGIGTRREPDDLWTVLMPYLRLAEVIDDKVSAKAPPDAVVDAIRRWLEADGDRRLLLLLDEADAFLETDARPREGKGADSRFANVYRLKNLMDRSARRFKPVFAGLHKVQRFHSVSNGPMGHVGAEILIGPLPPAEAYKLVVEPLAAIGYRIQKPDVVWRLLAYTNYQASLIQLFCDALVRRMHHRALAQTAPPTEITDSDIEQVYSDPEVRRWIASRFELTLDLDKRYRVVAYTTAWLTNTTDRQVFDSVALYDECKYFWPAGFADLSLDDFAAYLDEMVGLGVLVRTYADEYGIRSPNVIRLLGSPAEIERKLEESASLEVDALFDPAVFRRALGGDQDRRSPLTEQQAQQVLEGREAPDGRAQVHAVLGSRALGLDRVAEALRDAAPEDYDVRVVTCETVHAEIGALARARGGWQHVVLDLSGAVEGEQRTAVRRLHQFVSNGERRSGSCLVPPSAGWLWDSDLPDVRVRRVRIRPWTQDTLRAWAPDCVYPLSTAEQRHLLLADTGGWPQLVEAAVRAARRGSPETARQEALKRLAGGQATQEFLRSVGMPADPVTTAVARAAAIMCDEIAFDDLAPLVEEEAAAADRGTVSAAAGRLLDLGVLSNGGSSDSYLINPLIARLLSPR